MVGERHGNRSRMLRENIFDCKNEARTVNSKCVLAMMSKSAQWHASFKRCTISPNDTTKQKQRYLSLWRMLPFSPP